MELEIDQGNTRLKWRLDRRPMQHGNLDDLLHAVRNSRLRLARMVSVVSSSRQQQLISMIVVASSLPISWAIAKSTANSHGVKNAYAQPSQLGADRWCAIVAAALEFQPVARGLVVLGCGTAYTVDFIAPNKHHLGGWIAPGLVALAQGLRQSTNLSFDLAANGEPVDFGTTTNDGVSLGCREMLCGYVRRVTEMADRHFDGAWAAVLHGGDAQHIAGLLSDRIERFVEPELVFDGLGYVCGEAQHKHHHLGQ